MVDFDYARDKVLMGAKRDEVLTGKEKSMTAYHESGPCFAGLGWCRESTIYTRSRSSRAGGRWAPRNYCPRKTASTSAKRVAYAIVVPAGRPGGRETRVRRIQRGRRGRPEEGHPDRAPHGHSLGHERTGWGPLGVPRYRGPPLPGREIAEPRQFSEHTAQLIDEEVVRMLRAASDRGVRDAHAGSREARRAGPCLGGGGGRSTTWRSRTVGPARVSAVQGGVRPTGHSATS